MTMEGTLQDAISEYYAVREANAAGIPLAQFKAVSSLLNGRDADTDYNVTREGETLLVEFNYDDFLLFASVASDGSVTYH